MTDEEILESKEDLKRALQESVRMEKVDEMVRLWLLRLAVEDKVEQEASLGEVEEGLSELMGETSRHGQRLIELMGEAGFDFDYSDLYRDSLYEGVSEVSDEGITIDIDRGLREQMEHELQGSRVYGDLAEAVESVDLDVETDGLREELEEMSEEEERHAELVKDLRKNPGVGKVPPWETKKKS